MPAIIDTGRTFEIYSIGDGLFMRRVIDSVAAMNNAGVLMDLLALGLMIGLLVMGFRNVIHGGNKLELGVTLVSLLLGFMMFGMRADVVIHDMNFAPGEIDQPSYTVANVPFGVAAAGSVISGIGYELTLSMEQGFGLFGGRSSLIEGGFGNTLEWINSLRMWEVPGFSDGDGQIGRFRNNLSNYMDSCTRPAVEMGHLHLHRILASTDLWSYGSSDPTGPSPGGFGYNSMYLTTAYINDDGSVSTFTCNEGFTHIRNDSAVVPALYTEALAGSMLDTSSRGSSVQGALEDSYRAIGINAAEMQQLILAEVTGNSLTNAIQGKVNSAALTGQAKLMIEQAAIQRSIQWAAEETMFRRIMRPMMAFFESLMYALAPFTALVIGLGSFGIKTVGKYLMLSIWVVLWMPVLSIVELYQVTMMQHAVNAMRVGVDGTILSPGGASIAMADELRSQAIDWLSTGAALASFTPALTMALVWGGAVTASALASRLQGGDHVNEKMVAPDAVAPAPAIGASSFRTSSPGGGFTVTGAESSIPSIQWGQLNSTAVSSAVAGQQQTSIKAASMVSNAVQSMASDKHRLEAMAALREAGFSDFTNQGTSTRGQGVAGEEGARSEIHGRSAKQTADATSLGMEGGGSGNQPVVGGGSGGKGGGGKAGGIAALLATALGAQYQNRDSTETGATAGTSHSGARRDEAGFKVSATGSNGLKLEEFLAAQKGRGFEWAEQLTDTLQKSKEWSSTQSASQEYREQAQQALSFGTRQEERANVAAAKAINAGVGSQIVDDVLSQRGGREMLAVANESLKGSIPSATERQVAAAMLVQAGHYDTQGAMYGWDTSDGARGSRAGDLMSRMSGSPASAYEVGGIGGAGAFEGAGGQARDQAHVEGQIGAAPTGPGVDAAALSARVRGGDVGQLMGSVEEFSDPGRHLTGDDRPQVGADVGSAAQGRAAPDMAEVYSGALGKTAEQAAAGDAMFNTTQAMGRAIEEGNPLSMRGAIFGGESTGNDMLLSTNAATHGGEETIPYMERIIGETQGAIPGLSREQAYVVGAVMDHENSHGQNLTYDQAKLANMMYNQMTPEEQAEVRSVASEYGTGARQVTAMGGMAEEAVRDFARMENANTPADTVIGGFTGNGDGGIEGDGPQSNDINIR